MVEHFAASDRPPLVNVRRQEGSNPKAGPSSRARAMALASALTSTGHRTFVSAQDVVFAF